MLHLSSQWPIEMKESEEKGKEETHPRDLAKGSSDNVSFSLATRFISLAFGSRRLPNFPAEKKEEVTKRTREDSARKGDARIWFSADNK